MACSRPARPALSHLRGAANALTAPTWQLTSALLEPSARESPPVHLAGVLWLQVRSRHWWRRHLRRCRDLRRQNRQGRHPGWRWVSVAPAVALLARSSMLATPQQFAKVLGLSGGISDADSGLFLQGSYAKAYADSSTATMRRRHLDRPRRLAEGCYRPWHDLGLGPVCQERKRHGDNSSAHSIALGLNQKIDAAASSLYLTYENTAIDTSRHRRRASTPSRSRPSLPA